MKKELPKAVKNLSPGNFIHQSEALEIYTGAFCAGDRIIVIGTSTAPFNTDMKSLISLLHLSRIHWHAHDVAAVFQKIIMIPRPDYGSRLILWRHWLQQAGATVTSELDLSALSKISGECSCSQHFFQSHCG